MGWAARQNPLLFHLQAHTPVVFDEMQMAENRRKAHLHGAHQHCRDGAAPPGPAPSSWGHWASLLLRGGETSRTGSQQDKQPRWSHLFKGLFSPERGDLSPMLSKINISSLASWLRPPVRYLPRDWCPFSMQGIGWGKMSKVCLHLPTERGFPPFSHL